MFGMGTRAVDRSDDDYTRIIALNAPQLRPETSLDEVTEYAQRRVDVLDLEANRFTSAPIDEVVAESPEPAHRPVRDPPARRGRRLGAHLREAALGDAARGGDALSCSATLRDAYRYPVDVEFTANFLAGGDFRLNLVQCRPLQVKEGGIVPPPPDGLPGEDVVALEPRTRRGPEHERPRGPGDLRGPRRLRDALHAGPPRGRPRDRTRDAGRTRRAGACSCSGPAAGGRRTPSLGVPVSFAEIRRVAALGEM